MDVTGFVDLGIFEKQIKDYQASSCVVARALVATAMTDLCDWIRKQEDPNKLVMDVTKLERDRDNPNGFRGIPKKPEPGTIVNVGDVRDAAGYSLVIRGKGNRPLKAMYFVIPASIAAEIFPQQSFALPLIVGKSKEDTHAQKEEKEVAKGATGTPEEGSKDAAEERSADTLPSLEPEKPAREAQTHVFTQEEVDSILGVDPADPIAEEAALGYAEALQVNPAPQQQTQQNSGSGKNKNRK